MAPQVTEAEARAARAYVLLSQLQDAACFVIHPRERAQTMGFIGYRVHHADGRVEAVHSELARRFGIEAARGHVGMILRCR